MSILNIFLFGGEEIFVTERFRQLRFAVLI